MRLKKSRYGGYGAFPKKNIPGIPIPRINWPVRILAPPQADDADASNDAYDGVSDDASDDASAGPSAGPSTHPSAVDAAAGASVGGSWFPEDQTPTRLAIEASLDSAHVDFTNVSTALIPFLALPLTLSQLEIYVAITDPRAPRIFGLPAHEAVTLRAQREARVERINDVFHEWQSSIHALESHLDLRKRALFKMKKTLLKYIPLTKREAIYEQIGQKLMDVTVNVRMAEYRMRTQIARHETLFTEARHTEDQIRYMIHTRCEANTDAEIEEVYQNLLALVDAEE